MEFKKGDILQCIDNSGILFSHSLIEGELYLFDSYLKHDSIHLYIINPTDDTAWRIARFKKIGELSRIEKVIYDIP